MKLLLDQNLSRRLLPDIAVPFPGSAQVALLGLDAADDQTIWAYARDHGFAILTKDADFIDLAVTRGWPPKIIRLNLGNVPNTVVCDCLLRHAETIQEFLASPENGVLEID